MQNLKVKAKIQNVIWKILVMLVVFLLAGGVFSILSSRVRADELMDIAKQLEDLTRARELSEAATRPLEEEVGRLEGEIASIERKLKDYANKLEDLEESIKIREEDLMVQYNLLSARIRSYYKRSKHLSPLLIFFSSTSADDIARSVNYQAAAASEDRRIIVSVTSDLMELEEDKTQVEEDNKRLASLQAQLDKEADFFKGEIAEAKDYQASLSNKIAELSARQQAILQGKSGTFTSSVGEVPISKIPCSGPPGSPVFCNPGGGYFAAFSFGAWTHRKGMSQYGAKGRAEAGQSVNDIVSAYYGRGPVGKDTGGSISVTGFGDLDFEGYYLLGIAEMPSDWPFEALKAQAIAARSFAYRYKTQGRTICTTEACQVFSQSKANNPTGEWRRAVEETRGQVIEEVTAYYSSTAGAYLTYPQGLWDTTDSQGGDGFSTRAWESKAGSPWFYSSWYTQSYHSGSANCGRSSPWLTAEEMADILNAWLVLSQGSDERIMPVTINQCSIGGASGNPYSMAELRDKANSVGGAYSTVHSVNVTYSQGGETATVSFDTNRGNVSISGSEFKKAFNLRAPGYISILSPLFNIEKT